MGVVQWTSADNKIQRGEKQPLIERDEARFLVLFIGVYVSAAVLRWVNKKNFSVRQANKLEKWGTKRSRGEK